LVHAEEEEEDKEEEEAISVWSHAIAISASRDPARVKKLPSL